MKWFEPANFFNLDDKHALKGLLGDLEFVWELLDRLPGFIRERIKPNVALLRQQGALLTKAAAIYHGEVINDVTYVLDGKNGRCQVFHEGDELSGAALLMPGCILSDDEIEIGPGALVESGAMIKGPTIIGSGTEVRQGAYIRGSVMSFSNCIIGHATEAKNTLLLDEAKAGHFAYLGDSILGQAVNLGAGTKLANLKMLEGPYIYQVEDEKFTVTRRKFGAIFGDGVETGCNSVTSPGTIMGRNCRLLPNVTTKGIYYKNGSILR